MLITTDGNKIIDVSSTESDEVSFAKLSSDDISIILRMIDLEKAGTKTTLWSDRDFEEPNDIRYVVVDVDGHVTELHEIDILLQAIQDNKEIYAITLEYYM